MSTTTSIAAGWLDGTAYVAGGAAHTVNDPATDLPVATLNLAGGSDVDLAVMNAQRAT